MLSKLVKDAPIRLFRIYSIPRRICYIRVFAACACVWIVHWPVGGGGVGEDGIWFVWCWRWNDGDYIIGFYNETGSRQKCYGEFVHGV